MADNKAIQELFQPLAARLTIIENQMAEPYTDPPKLLKDIGEHIMVLPEGEIIPALEKQIKWLNSISEIGSYNDQIDKLPGFVEMPWTTEEDKKKYNEEISKELKYYHSNLAGFVEKIKYYSTAQVAHNNNPIQPIILPENFTLQQLLENTKFKPVLSVNEAALFLGYMRDMGYIPNFANDGLGEIGLLFGKSKQNVRTAYKTLNDRKEEAYKTSRESLISHLQTIIAAIDKDLQPVEKI